MNLMLFFWFLVTSAAAMGLGWPLCWLLNRYRILDQPNQRSSHVAPTPRGGGIAILMVLAGASLWVGVRHADRLTWILPLVIAGVGFISLIDDVRGVPAGIRFGAHLGGALVLEWAAGFFDSAGPAGHVVEGFHVPHLVVVVVMCLWIAGYTNSFNFMDGINGIAGVQAGVGGMVMALVVGLDSGKWGSVPVLISMAISGAAFGFLPHNFPKARMFMGDVGSAPLGMVLAFMVLWLCREHGFHLFIPLSLVFLNFILDTVITLARRIWRGDAWLEPHREHFYQRLIRSGRSHAFVTGCEGGLLLVSGLVALVVVGSGWMGQVLAAGGVCLMWGAFFWFAEMEFRYAEARRATA